METVREAWTDQRLDDLGHKVDRLDTRIGKVEQGLSQVEHRLDEMDKHIDRRLGSIETHLEGLEDRFAIYQRAMLQMSALVIAALLGIIATQV